MKNLIGGRGIGKKEKKERRIGKDVATTIIRCMVRLQGSAISASTEGTHAVSKW